ncbi:disulfide bond formation protein B [Croceibacterium sp. TMG7-5b_MA50]|uniref:disulfide bond formation protein B n=1 Tax=Croceibacterium sp. TMG7-5b_MA50 TaxID=3121290 RepID=UPI0032220372
MTSDLRLAQRLALAVPAVLLAGAYLSQYAFGLPPCEMCWWQRYAHFAALAFALLALPLARTRPALLALAALAICVSGMIGGFHAGVEYGWWPGITTCAQPAGLGGGGDPLAAIMDAPLVRCDVAPWTLAGVSLAGWNALLSLLAGLAVFRLLGLEKRA